MIGILHQVNEGFYVDCYDGDTFVELLPHPQLQHVGGPRFRVLASNIAEAGAIYIDLLAHYGGVVEAVPDDTQEARA